MTQRVQKTLEFLQEQFERSAYFQQNPAQKNYRFEHSIRVANVAAQIARAEGMDEELMTLAGLLHDVAYGQDFPDDYDWNNHGRDSARIARPLLESLGLSEMQVNDICYAIAIHVDDKADFQWERTAFSETVSDADNIDRFDAYRIYETIKYKGFEELELDGRIAWLRTRLEQLERLRDFHFGTETARSLWWEKLDFQVLFFERMLKQMKTSQMDEERSDAE